MRRVTVAPRPDRQARWAAIGFEFAEIGGQPYWDESACWQFSAAEIDTLDDATVALERLCHEAVARAVRTGCHAQLGIPDAVWPLVVRSWEAQEPGLLESGDMAEAILLAAGSAGLGILNAACLT